MEVGGVAFHLSLSNRYAGGFVRSGTQRSIMNAADVLQVLRSLHSGVGDRHNRGLKLLACWLFGNLPVRQHYRCVLERLCRTVTGGGPFVFVVLERTLYADIRSL